MQVRSVNNFTSLEMFAASFLTLIATLLICITFSSNILSYEESTLVAVSTTEQTEVSTTKDYYFVAEPCDSLTKLVRRSLLTFDAANDQITLTKPGIIYAETNIVQNMGAYWLDIGQSVTVDGQAVSDYAARSLNLSESEIAAWNYYVPFVDFEIVTIQTASNEQEVVDEIVDLTTVEEITPIADNESTPSVWWIAGIGASALVWYLLWKREEQS